MGLVIDRDIAFKECHGYSLDSQKLLWSAGVIGMLSDEQEKLCEKITIRGEVPKELESRYLFFKTSADKCSRETENLPKGEKLVKFLECMSKEAKEKGIEI